MVVLSYFEVSGFIRPEHSIIKNDRNPSLFVTDTKTKDDVFWKVLKYREGKGINFESEEPFGYYKGIYLFPQISMISHHGGGSTPMNLIAKQLYGGKYFEEYHDECPWYAFHSTLLCRKYMEARVARDLYDYLAEHNGTEFKRWISMHVPLVTNGGGDSFGIQAAAAILFAKKPEELSAGEQALLATAYKKPLMLTGNFQLDKIKKITINAYICERKYVCNEEFEEPEFTECKRFFKDEQIKENPKRCDELWNRDASTHKALTININPEYRWLFNAFKARKFVMTDELFTSDQQKQFRNELDSLVFPVEPKMPEVLKKFYNDGNDSDIKDEDGNNKFTYENLFNRSEFFVKNSIISDIENSLRSIQKQDSKKIVEVKLSFKVDKNFKFSNDLKNVLGVLV